MRDRFPIFAHGRNFVSGWFARERRGGIPGGAAPLSTGLAFAASEGKPPRDELDDVRRFDHLTGRC